MEKVIKIDGKPVKFRATAAVPRLYRIKFRRDMLIDMQSLAASMGGVQSGEGQMPIEMLEIFENVAFIMAKHADKDAIPDTVEEWLDSMEMMDIWSVFPELSDLWTANMDCMVETKKKLGPAPVR